MMREVISAGGVFIRRGRADARVRLRERVASRICSGRHVPDLCGPVGEARNGAAYIMLPVDPGCEPDRLRGGTRRRRRLASSAAPRRPRRSSPASARCCWKPTPA
jgi:hypothetical protein